MAISIMSKFKKVWNVFLNKDDASAYRRDIGVSSYSRPDRVYVKRGAERTIINSIYNRIAVDVSEIDIKHVRLDENNRYLETIYDGLNRCLTVQANIDQGHKEFIHDVCLSMLDEGCVAIVPVDTDSDPETGSFDIDTMRVGRIVEWYPRDVKVELYNDISGKMDTIIFAKESTAIVENPFYSVMNATNSTIQRLIRKLSILDILDEKTGQGKLDLIIQLPYVIRNSEKQKMAEERRKDVERQLASSTYGIAYIDGTEHITQLNRPAENNLLAQIEYLTNMAYSQLGINVGVLDGTANEETMMNYYSRIITPIISRIANAMKIAFLTKTAITQRQSIEYFRDPFGLVPVGTIAEMADKFTRNEIMTSNEIRQIIGLLPSKDPNADVLRNKNLNSANTEAPVPTEESADESTGSSEVDALLTELEEAFEE